MDWRKARLHGKRLALKIGKRLPWGKSGTQVYLRDRVAQYEGMWTHIADAIGGRIIKLDRDLWELHKDGRHIRVRLHEFPLDNNIVLKLCGRKPLVHRLLSAGGIPVPQHAVFGLGNLDPAIAFLQRHPLGCVVKPADGYAGKGVTTHVRSVAALENASVLASLYLPDLLIEEQIVGETFRLLVYKGQVLHATRRSGQRLAGDGKSSVQELLGASRYSTVQDDDLTFTLAAQGIGLETVPEDQRALLARSIGGDFSGGVELRTVYDTKVTATIHDSIRRDAEQCAAIAQASLLGVDIITTDIGKDLRETGGVVNEINTTPALHHHYEMAVEAFPEPALVIARDLLQLERERV